MKKLNIKVLIISLVIVFLVAFIGSLFTDTGDWYESIKPSITPPNFVFPIAWTILFILIALSLYTAWTNSVDKKPIIIVFTINLGLIIYWSIRNIPRMIQENRFRRSQQLTNK